MHGARAKRARTGAARRWAVLALAGLLAAGCSKTDPVPRLESGTWFEPGVWSVAGTDAQLGDYTGTLEIREGAGGSLDVIRIVRLDRFTHADGRGVDLVWTGNATLTEGGETRLGFLLLRADFIPQVGALVRSEADKTPLAVTALVTEGDGRALGLEYVASDDPAFAVSETGAFTGAPGAEPLWRSGRQVRETFDEDAAFTRQRAGFFDFFATFHALPAVQPYVDDPRFQRAVQFQVVERTDFEYYRAHPDRLRVVNKVVDAISLAETEIRANAFRATFAAKAAHYQSLMDAGLVGPHGMVLRSLPAGGGERSDSDGNLWTGVYAYTQALRYRVTGDPGALDNLRRSVAGILTTMDITGDPETFARTLRMAGPPVTGSWRRGTGEFAHLDWRTGGNNDMSKGLLLGIVAAWDALPEGDPLRAEIPSHAVDLLELCAFRPEGPATCEGANPPSGFPSASRGVALLLAGITNEDQALLDQGLSWMRDPLLLSYTDAGGGPLFAFGISDWSGNHLAVAANSALEWALARSGDVDLEQRWRRASGEAWRMLRRLDSPLHAAKAAVLRGLDDPVEQAAAVEDARWGLRAFPLPKHGYPVDYRVRGDFVMSPFPALPWKLDWETNPGRQQSLVGHGLVESAVDSYAWNDGPFAIASGGAGADLLPGVDYLFLYWLARDGGLVTALD